MNPAQWLAKSVPPTKSVLSPLQWFNATMSAAFTSIVIFGPSSFQLLGFIGLCVVGCFYLAAYSYFALKDPQRLHSEGHRERIAELDRRGPGP